MPELNTRVRVIIVTDGDRAAQKAIEKAAAELRLFPVRVTAGNPTPVSGFEALSHIMQSPYEPVVIMVDDKGRRGTGAGEMVIEYLMHNPDKVIVLGVVAVASHTRVKGIKVYESVTADGQVIKRPVNKDGHEEKSHHCRLEGDTIEILQKYPHLLIIGCGDPGKSEGFSAIDIGSAVMRKCFEEILNRTQGSRQMVLNNAQRRES